MSTKELIAEVEQKTGQIVRPRTKAGALETLRKWTLRNVRFESKIRD
jgi:hypothetical protein